MRNAANGPPNDVRKFIQNRPGRRAEDATSDQSQSGAPEYPWEQKGNNFRAWFASVEQLTAASRRVYDSTTPQLSDGRKLMPAINAVAAMLIGYAIECVLKGLWLRAGQSLIVKGRFKLPEGGKHHDLAKLARAVSRYVHLPLSVHEQNILQRLSASLCSQEDIQCISPLRKWNSSLTRRAAGNSQRFSPKRILR